MTIRLMNLGDYDNVYALWVGTTGMGMNEADDSREGIARYLARNPRTCFVAESEGRIVGAILGGHDGRRGFIYHAAVALTERGQGIGCRLVDCVVAALVQEGIHKAALVAFRQNLIANEFWEKRGFLERTDLCYRNREIGPTAME
ncbi:MAG: GNAT family N-acetyltransferase [Eubacteriales bacterium]|nr:GNAT family N-acetyltransferase [Eubacteriales bacterium]